MHSDLRERLRHQENDRAAPQRGRQAVALLSVCLGFFVIQLDVTIVNVALPAIQREIGGTLAGLQWVIDAYTLALASIMLTAGATADRAGARKIFTAGLTVFAIGSAACAAAPTLGVLIAARAVQGLVASAGWRSIFLVNVPICLLTVVLLRRFAAESPTHQDRRTDVPGLLLGVTMLAALTASFITAGGHGQGWTKPLPVTLLVAGLVAAWAFTRAERRHPHPVLPLELFTNKNLSGATAVGLIFNLVLYGSLLCLSLYLQTTRHGSVLATGLLLLPMSTTVGLGSLASGRLTAQLGPITPMIAGLTFAAAGAALLATAGPETSITLILAGSILLGLVSLAMPAMTAAVVGAAGPEHAGVASGVLNAARQSGGALGVAVLGSLLGHGPELSLHVPLLVATAGYLVAIALALGTIRRRPHQAPGSG